MRTSWLILLLACDDGDKGGGGNGGDDSGGSDDTGSPPDCTATVVSTDPTDGEVDVPTTQDLVVVLSEPDDGASITTDIPGSLSVSADGLTLTWTVDGDLDAGTSYSWTVQACGESTTYTFTTLDVATPDWLIGLTWSLDLSDATIAEPEILALLEGTYFTMPIFLLTVPDAGPGTVDLRFATTLVEDPGVQDTCVATTDWDDAAYDDGQVYGTAETMNVPLTGAGSVEVYNVTFTGRFAEDGSTFDEGTISGMGDVRALGEDLGMDADEVCALLEGLGSPCEACPDGSSYCLTLVLTGMYGATVDTEVIDVPADDCPGCATGVPECDQA